MEFHNYKIYVLRKTLRTWIEWNDRNDNFAEPCDTYAELAQLTPQIINNSNHSATLHLCPQLKLPDTSTEVDYLIIFKCRVEMMMIDKYKLREADFLFIRY